MAAPELRDSQLFDPSWLSLVNFRQSRMTQQYCRPKFSSWVVSRRQTSDSTPVRSLKAPEPRRIDIRIGRDDAILPILFCKTNLESGSPPYTTITISNESRSSSSIPHRFNPLTNTDPFGRISSTFYKRCHLAPLIKLSFLRRLIPFRSSTPILGAALFQQSRPASTMAPTHTKVAIIGSGPAAHTAAVYLSRAELQPILYEGFLAGGTAAGGQLTTTTEVENYPGFPGGITGPELMDAMRAQSEKFGTKIVTETISKLDVTSRPFKMWVEYSDGPNDAPTLTADAVVIATGANARRLGLPGEDKYWQNGISACAVCDGAVPIFRNKPLVVIGGGDSAAEEAMFLTKYGSKVTVLVRKDRLRASKAMAQRLINHPKCEVKFNHQGIEVLGDDSGLMRQLKIKNNKTGEEEVLEANGLFYAVGHDPASALVKGQVDCDEDGYILTQPGTSLTSVPGVFAAGDVQDKKYRQAITSAGSGCIAALEAEKFLAEHEDGPSGPEQDKDVKKGDLNGAENVPEYRSNPLL